MFKKLEGDQALLMDKGVYKQADLYEFQGGLFAKYGSGYIRLKANGSTSKGGVDLKHLETEYPLFKDAFDRLALSEGAGRKPVALSYTGDVLKIEDRTH